VKIGLYFLQPN